MLSYGKLHYVLMIQIYTNMKIILYNIVFKSLNVFCYEGCVFCMMKCIFDFTCCIFDFIARRSGCLRGFEIFVLLLASLLSLVTNMVLSIGYHISCDKMKG